MVSKVVPLWFSRLVISGRVRDVHKLHGLLWRGFDTEQRPFLFRADVVRSSGRPQTKVLVQSTLEASWEELGERLVSEDQVFREIDLVEGEKLRFFLRANPTVRRKGRAEPAFKGLDDEAFLGKRGRRVALLREDDRLAWLDRKAETGGFEVIRKEGSGGDVVRAVRVTNSRPWRWTSKKHVAPARHDGVDFEGLLEVKDPEEMAATLTTGIGTAKAFGFGLLSLARRRR